MKIMEKTGTLQEVIPERDFEMIQGVIERYLSVYCEESDPVKRQEQYTIASLLTFHLYVAVSHFVYVSPYASDIAKSINTTPKVILELSEEPEWGEMLLYFGYRGDPKPIVAPRNNTPVPLREEFLLEKVFQKHCDVRFVTYDGFIDTSVKKVERYYIVLAKNYVLQKQDVILAFPKDKMQFVKVSIKRRKSIADLGLKPILHPRDRPKIDVNARLGDEIECVMRNGLVIRGENIWISKYNIVMRVGGEKRKDGKVVLLYRHALHAFGVIQEKPQRQHVADNDAFDEESDDGNG